MRPLSRLALAVLAVFSANALSAQNDFESTAISSTKLDLGFSYSRGDYGLTEDTTVFVVPATLSYEEGPWTWRATVPWVMIDGPATIIGGSAASATSGPLRPTDGNESGLGDSSLALTYKTNPGANRLNVDLTGRVKFPTGDEDRGIGTGETDYSAQMDLYRTYGKVTPFGTVGYRWLGDGLYQLEDGWYASGGVLFTVSTSNSVGVSYERREAIVAGGDDASEGSVFLFHRFNDRWNGSFTAMKGFTDASADFGLSSTVMYRF